MFLRFLLLALICFSVNATEYGKATVSEVRTVYDGDSFRVNIDSGFVNMQNTGILKMQLSHRAKQEHFGLFGVRYFISCSSSQQITAVPAIHSQRKKKIE